MSERVDSFGKPSKRIYAISGTHGTGKTTAVFDLASRLKREYPCMAIGIVSEVTRACPYPVVCRENNRVNESAQRWIFCAQTAAELEALKRYDLVVSDRSIADCIAYTLAGGMDNLADSMLKMASWHMNVYRQIFFRRVERSDWLKDDAFRNLDTGFRLRVEAELAAVYRALGFKTTPCNGEVSRWNL